QTAAADVQSRTAMTVPSPVQALPRARFQLSQMLGAGEDGAAYLGRDGDGPPVVVRRLKKLPFERRRWLEQRLKLRALAEGPCFVDLIETDLDGEAPVIVPELVSGTLANLLGQGAVERDVALKVCHSLALALSAAHRLGAAHGSLDPHRVHLRDDFS